MSRESWVIYFVILLYRQTGEIKNFGKITATNVFFFQENHFKNCNSIWPGTGAQYTGPLLAKLRVNGVCSTGNVITGLNFDLLPEIFSKTDIYSSISSKKPHRH
jgi:hypothetical protein